MEPTKTPRTLQEYVEAPCQCPFCHSDTITGGPLLVESGEVYQEVSCDDCSAKWKDWFKGRLRRKPIRCLLGGKE